MVLLENLDVSCTEITDAGVVHLRSLVPVLLSLPSLETLNLKSLPLSDAAIERLEALPGLYRVVFSGLQSRAGVETLKKLRPECDVILDGRSI